LVPEVGADIAEPWRDSVFRTRWWLDAVAPGQWGEVIVVAAGEPQAHLAFLRRHLPFGLSGLGLPALTPWVGPWLRPEARDRRGLLTALIEQLPHSDYFSQNLDPWVEDWLPFAWQGFSSSLRYTYVIEDVSDPDQVWAAMRDKTRNSIRKAEKLVEIRETRDASGLTDLVRASFERQQLEPLVSPDIIRRALGAALDNSSGQALEAVDADGHRHAALMVVWDRDKTYYLMGGADPAYRSSQASSALIWRAIQNAAMCSRQFDFEGSMLPGVEPFFRGFGGRQVPYFSVHRASRPVRALLAARDLGRAVLGRS
jgi:hypothetical protein